MTRARVFIACSPSARVGVTTTARLITDYHLYTGAPVEGFDADPHEPRYGELFPDIVRAIDASDIKGQIALFDRLLRPDGVTRVVDVWRRVYPKFVETVREIGFVEEARRVGIEPVFLYHPEATQLSFDTALRLRRYWPDLQLVLVHNEGANPQSPEGAELLRRLPAHGRFVVAALPEPVARILDGPSLSLSQFLRAPPPEVSIVVRAALRTWIAPVFTQFRSFELRGDLSSGGVLG
jgi:hypothetical protein